MSVKSGWKTSEIIVVICTIAANVATAVAGDIPGRYASVASAVAAAGYAISRGLAKISPNR